MIRTIFATAVLVCGGMASATDLLDAWQAAMRHDANYAAARHALAAGQEKATQGDALLLPKVSLNANTGYAYNRSEYDQPGLPIPDIRGDGQNYGYGVTLVQPVYRAQAFAGRDQLHKQSELAELQFRQAQQDLILRVGKSYFELLAARDKVALTEAQKSAVAEQLARAKKAFEVGDATIADTDEAQASYDNILAGEIAARNDLEIKRNAFELITGLPADGIHALREQIRPTGPVPDDLAFWQQKAGQSGLAIAGQQLALEIAGREIDKYKLEKSPTLDLVAGYSQSRQAGNLGSVNFNDKTLGGQVALQLNIPLFTGGDRSSHLREAAAQEAQQRELLEATRRDTSQQTRNAFLGVKSGVAQINALEQLVRSSETVLASSKLGRDVGVRTTVDVLNAEQKLYGARYDLAVARYAYLYAGLQLAAVAGELDEKQLQAVNSWLAK